jgi:uncharacterized membrane protein
MNFRHLAMIAAFTICLSLFRFGHHTPDSRHYVNLAKYFRGEAPKEDLHGPYAYRVLIPYLAASIPFDNLDLNFALINVAATVLAYLLFMYHLKRFVTSETELYVGMLILVFSFPTFNYASGVLTDPAGFLMVVLASFLLLKEKYYLLSAVIGAGVLVRESLLTMVLVSWIYLLLSHPLGEIRLYWRRLGKILSCLSILPLATFVGVRLYFSDVLSHMQWGLSLQSFLRNITEPKIGMLTFFFTLLPPLVLVFLGYHRSGWTPLKNLEDREKRFLLSMSTVSILLIIYSNCFEKAYMSGRFVWPFYSALIPMTVLMSRSTSFYTRWLIPLSERIFGSRKLIG